MTALSAPDSRQAEDRSARIAVTVFPLLILAAALVGFLAPETAKTLLPQVNLFLGIIMFGMGLTLTLPDFALVAKRPLPVLLGVVAQYAIMPLLGLAVALLLRLPPELAAGVILVGSAPGGTSSNVISYLARADTALSVAMTSVSTLLAPLLTPLLTLWLAGQYMAVDGAAMAASIVTIVLLPVLGGLVVRLLLHRLVDRVLPALPWVSVVFIALVVAAVVGNSAATVLSAGALVLLAVVLHNGLGYALGYGLARALRVPVRSARTVSIEVGMQNSGLAAGLAAQYISPAAALPGAVFSLWHNLSGAVLALLFRRSDARTADRA
ncbi:bile acid:sodium symporter family protein [Micrococcus flavus]|uniref:BASS family bile acid:Na+ symporter n=1 Tax=Micrococcus flavus TaxID=384602 RepID=A0A4Y8WUW8_9MICC|nr:bile acid:sodium symporter family protein [Micrococcus flavus]MBB4881668.1 BASS family bile acid:Na+ symporter [Micrococcus flavus]TFH98654.1 bile acid:sodium symporter family protein [Micrococcus flavus]GGK54915.1 Na+-dependent transporter [Micrococcus flavus]